MTKIKIRQYVGLGALNRDIIKVLDNQAGWFNDTIDVDDVDSLMTKIKQMNYNAFMTNDSDGNIALNVTDYDIEGTPPHETLPIMPEDIEGGVSSEKTKLK